MDEIIVDDVNVFSEQQVATALLLANAYRAGLCASVGNNVGEVVAQLHQYESVIDDLLMNIGGTRLDGVFRKSNACLSVTHDDLMDVDDYYIISVSGKVVGCSP